MDDRLDWSDVDTALVDIRETLEQRGEEYGFDAIQTIADIMRILFPNGFDIEDFDRHVGVTHVILKLVRYAQIINTENLPTRGSRDSARDLAGYACLLHAIELKG